MGTSYTENTAWPGNSASPVTNAELIQSFLSDCRDVTDTYQSLASQERVSVFSLLSMSQFMALDALMNERSGHKVACGS